MTNKPPSTMSSSKSDDSGDSDSDDRRLLPLGRPAVPSYLSIQTNFRDAPDQDLIEAAARTSRRDPRGRQQEVKGTLLVFLTAAMFVTSFVAVRVLLPIYSASTSQAGGDSFTLLFHVCLFIPFLLVAITALHKALWDRSASLLPAGVPWRVVWLMGGLSLANGICSTFASHPERTPPHLQGILLTSRIPFTVLTRFLLLRKGLSLRRLGCTVAVLIGIFITLEPQIFGLSGSGNASKGGSGFAHVIWPTIYAFGFLPAAVNTVICERELKQGEVQSLSLITWTQVFQLLTILPLFWLDFIPFFGMAKDIRDFGERMRMGFKCNFSGGSSCQGLALKGWLFILAYCLGNLFQFLLIRKAEGAVFAVVVQSTVAPLAALFWTFFAFDGQDDALSWQPRFTETTAFTLGGLGLIMPAVVLYNVFSQQEARQQNYKQDVTERNS